jgi:hypothetical protein
MTSLDSGSAIRVALFDLGERLQVNLESLSHKLNSLQSSFTFTTVAPITLAKIGDPTIQEDWNTWYEFQPMFDLLRSHDSFTQYSYIIGITHLGVTERVADTGKSGGEYFSLSDIEKVAVISLNANVLKHNSPSKSAYQYLANLIVCELLIMLCKKDLIHAKNNFCLFDDCVDRALFCQSIERGEICEECRYELKKHNISNKVITDVLAVLKWCKTDSIKYSVVNTIFHPFTLLSIGTGLGWLGSALVWPSHYVAVLCLLLSIPVVVFIYKRCVS